MARLAIRNLSANSLIFLPPALGFHVLDERLELLDVLGRQLPVLGEGGDHRSELSVEHAVEEALALLALIVLAADQRTVHVPVLRLAALDRLLGKQAMD